MAVAESSRFVLPGLTLEILGQALGVSVRQYPLSLPYLGGDGVDAIHAVRRAHADLQEGGLAQDEKLHPEVERAVLMLGRAPTSVGVMADDSQGQWLARAVFDGEKALLVEQVGDQVEFTWLRPQDWHNQLAELLPPMRRAPGGTVRTTASSGRRPEADLSEVSLLEDNRAATRSARPTGTMSDVRQVFAAPRTASGHFAITGTDRIGKSVTAPGLSWIDTELGAYATTSESHQGRNLLTFAPVDNNELGQLLRDRTDSVRT